MSKKIVAAIHVFNMSSIPFNRGLEAVGGAISNSAEKLSLIKETIVSYITNDPGMPLEKLCIINQGTDCEYTKAFLNKLHNTRTRYGTLIVVLDAPDVIWKGPFGSREFTYRQFPDMDYYFETDSDNMVTQTGWLKFIVNKMEKNHQIGLLGAYLDRKGFQAPNTVKWITKDRVEIAPPVIKYNSGAWTLIPRHIFEGFDKYWCRDWINQGTCFFDYAGAMGELYYAFKVEQLGYINEDLTDENVDAPYDWIVPDRLFPNFTIGNTRTIPKKKFISPFFNTYLYMKDTQLVEFYIQGFYKNCKRV